MVSRSFKDDGALAEVIACALAHERVELVQEDGGRRVVARHLEEHLHVHEQVNVLNVRCSMRMRVNVQQRWLAHADELLGVAAPLAHDGGGGDVEEGGAALGGDGLGEQRLAGARRTVEQQALPRRQDAREQLRVLRTSTSKQPPT